MLDIDPTSDDAVSLTDACRLLPRGRNGSKPHLSTLLRWIRIGVPGPDGQRVKLAALRCGGKWITSRAALREFAAALTPRVESDSQPSPVPRSPRARRRASERAAAKLESMSV